MNWLTKWMMREGPGVPKNAPPKKGLALFAQIVGREAWELFKLNLIIVGFSLPIVTAPAALAAAMRVSSAMIRDENVYLLRDYWIAFRALFWRASLAGFIALAAIGLGVYSVFIWGQLATAHPLFAIPMVACLAGTLFVAMAAAYLFALMANSGAPLPGLVRAALLAALARPLPILAGLLAVAALWLAHIVFYPVSVFMPAVLNFSLGALILTFSAFPATQRVLASTSGTRETVSPRPFASTRAPRQKEEKSCENY